MDTTRTREMKTITIRVPDDELEAVRQFIADGHASTTTGAVQGLVTLGITAHAREVYERTRRTSGPAGMRDVIKGHVHAAHKALHQLVEVDPVAARVFVLELLAQDVRLAGRINETADASVPAPRKRLRK